MVLVWFCNQRQRRRCLKNITLDQMQHVSYFTVVQYKGAFPIVQKWNKVQRWSAVSTALNVKITYTPALHKSDRLSTLQIKYIDRPTSTRNVFSLFYVYNTVCIFFQCTLKFNIFSIFLKFIFTSASYTVKETKSTISKHCGDMFSASSM